MILQYSADRLITGWQDRRTDGLGGIIVITAVIPLLYLQTDSRTNMMMAPAHPQ